MNVSSTVRRALERAQPPVIQDATARIGAELNNKWRLLRLLGVGGTSAVYEAMHRNGRRAALKLFDRPDDVGTRGQRRARQESHFAIAVDHPGVVAVLDDDIAEDGTAYLVMELLLGETLEARRRRRGGHLPLAEAVPIFERVLDVLSSAHGHGIVHRDIKPTNVFLTRDGGVKVLDFGLATAFAAAGCPGSWLGTPGYIAPEQARGEFCAVDGKADLWSAAATLYTVITGALVHARKTPQELVDAAAREEVELTWLDAAAPPSVADVITRALAFDPADRWPSARVFRDALRLAVSRGHLRPVAAPIPDAPPVPNCHSSTRVFRLDMAPGDARGRRRACGVTCTMCPECPELRALA